MKKMKQRKPETNPVTNPEFEIPSWTKISSLLLNLAKKIQKNGYKPDIIVGVSRGGWIPARILSDLLENPKLANVSTQFYVGIAKTEPEPTIIQPVSISVKDKKVLVVDDLADSGKSLKIVKSHLKKLGTKEIKIATIYYKPWSIIIPHYYEKQTKNWIVFPWEQKETVRKILEQTINQNENRESVKEKLISCGLNRKHVEQFIKEITEEKQ